MFTALHAYYPMGISLSDLQPDLEHPDDPLTREELLDKLEDDIMDAYARREDELGATLVRDLERWVLLQLIDQHWREHLYNMDYLREGIHLRALGQKDPLSEYRLEGHTMFDEMMTLVKGEFVRYMFHIQVDQAPEAEEQKVADVDYSYQSDPIQGFAGAADDDDAEMEAEESSGSVAVVEQRVLTDDDKVGRNDPCPAAGRRPDPDEHRLDALARRPRPARRPPPGAGRRPGRLSLTPLRWSAASRSSNTRWATRASGTTRPTRPASRQTTRRPAAG
jgi:preprotein translocase subunit SecA